MALSVCLFVIHPQKIPKNIHFCEMKSNFCYIYSQKCTLETAVCSQLEKIRLISTTRLSKLDLIKVTKKKGPKNQNVNSACHVPVLLADAPGNSPFPVSDSEIITLEHSV